MEQYNKVSMKNAVIVGRVGLNRYQLKCIALFCMTLDHFAKYALNKTSENPLHIIGRIAFPIFLYMVADAMHHTRNHLKYIGRLYGFHAILVSIGYLLQWRLPKFGEPASYSVIPILFFTAYYIQVTK